MAGIPVQKTVQTVVREMSIGAISSHDARKREDWERALDEYDCQLIMPVKGRIGSDPLWIEIELLFNVYFINSVDNPKRESPHKVPIFTYGCQRIGKTKLFTQCNVIDWIGDTDEEGGGITGAIVELGMLNPSADPENQAQQEFEIELHCNFQGYGGPLSDLEELEGDK